MILQNLAPAAAPAITQPPCAMPAWVQWLPVAKPSTPVRHVAVMAGGLVDKYMATGSTEAAEKPEKLFWFLRALEHGGLGSQLYLESDVACSLIKNTTKGPSDLYEPIGLVVGEAKDEGVKDEGVKDEGVRDEGSDEAALGVRPGRPGSKSLRTIMPFRGYNFRPPGEFDPEFTGEPKPPLHHPLPGEPLDIVYEEMEVEQNITWLTDAGRLKAMRTKNEPSLPGKKDLGQRALELFNAMTEFQIDWRADFEKAHVKSHTGNASHTPHTGHPLHPENLTATAGKVDPSTLGVRPLSDLAHLMRVVYLRFADIWGRDFEESAVDVAHTLRLNNHSIRLANHSILDPEPATPGNQILQANVSSAIPPKKPAD